MDDLERLDFEIGPLAADILDKLDYGRLRQLGGVLRNIPHTSEDEDWDYPPASLQGWIASYEATLEAFQIAERSGFLTLIKSRSETLQALLSPAMIPSLDAYIVERETIETMISQAKERDRFKDLDFERFSSNAASREEIAGVIVVTLDESIRWDERPKIDKSVWPKRLQVGALIGKAAAGGALTVANLALGVLAGLSVVPTIPLAHVPIAVGIIGSAYTGLAAACDAVEKIAAVVRG